MVMNRPPPAPYAAPLAMRLRHVSSAALSLQATPFTRKPERVLPCLLLARSCPRLMRRAPKLSGDKLLSPLMEQHGRYRAGAMPATLLSEQITERSAAGRVARRDHCRRNAPSSYLGSPGASGAPFRQRRSMLRERPVRPADLRRAGRRQRLPARRTAALVA
jgi:hypothetical protein